MLPRNLILGFLWRFVAWYGLLVAPWPGFNEAYGRYFRALGQLVMAQENGHRMVHFEVVPPTLRHGLDSRIELGNRDQLDRNGNGPVIYLELDTRGIGWVPTALMMALILSTPVAWRRRGWALLAGLVAVHAFILFSVAIYIWNNSTELALLTLGPLAKRIAAGMEETLITQMGASFVVPVLIWMFVVFRRQDVGALQGLTKDNRHGRIDEPLVAHVGKSKKTMRKVY